MIDSIPANEQRARVDVVTVIAIAVITYAAANICHEIIGHCGMAAIVGTKCKLISSTYIPLADEVPTWKYNIIVIAGCTANFIAAFVCLVLLRRWRSAQPALRYFLWLTMSVNLFLASTYITAAPIIKYGDSYILIHELRRQFLWRSAVVLAGAILCWFSFLLSRHGLRKLVGCGGPSVRFIAWKLVVPAYIAGGSVTVASALFSPLDARWAQLQAAGGTFGLTFWLLLLPFGIRDQLPATRPFTLPRSVKWIAAGAVTALIFIGALGHGISLEDW